MANIYPISEIELPNGDILIIESQGENQSQILPFALPEEFGAIGDGTTDDTYAIEQAFMTKKPVLFDKTKIYSITSIVLDSNSILLGNGSTLLFDGSRADGGIAIKDNKENIYIENLNLKAKYTNKKNGRGINISKSKNVKIYNCHIDGQAIDEDGNFRAWIENDVIDGYGSYNGISILNSEYIVVDNCSIKNIWSQGLASSYSQHLTITNNHFQNTGRGGIYIMGGNTNAEISNNTLLNCVKYFNVADAAIDVYGEPVSAEELKDPNRKGLPNYALRIVNNYIKGFGSEIEPGCGILIKGTYGAVCENNTIISDTETRPMAGIMLQDRNRTETKDCVINNNLICFEECYRNPEEDVSEDEILASEFGHLIRIFDTVGSKNIIISNNILKSNQRGVTGVTIKGSTENTTIENNIIECPKYYGIKQKKNSGESYIQKNLKIINNVIKGRVSTTSCEGLYLYDNDIYMGTDSTSITAGAVYSSNSSGIEYKRNHLKNKTDTTIFEYFENCADFIDCQGNLYYNSDGSPTYQRACQQSLRTAITNAEPNSTILLLKEANNYNILLTLTGEKNHGKTLDTTGASYFKPAVKFPENLTLKGALPDAGVIMKAGLSITSGVTSEESYQQSNIQDAILSKGLTIENITFQSDVAIRNCQIEGLKIINCVFGTNATVQLDPHRFINMYGSDYGDSKPSDTRYGAHKLRLINPIIQNCTFQNTGMSKTSDICSIYARCVDGIIVQNNKITGSKGDGIQITGFSGTIGAKGGCRSCGKIIIGNNTITNIYKRGIRLSYLENADIELLYNSLNNVSQNGDAEHIKLNYFSGYNNKVSKVGNTYNESVDNIKILIEGLSQIADFIIEQKSVDDWYYRKWNSGTVELFRTYELVNDIEGLGYLNEKVYYPFAFDVICVNTSIVGNTPARVSYSSGDEYLELFSKDIEDGVNVSIYVIGSSF